MVLALHAADSSSIPDTPYDFQALLNRLRFDFQHSLNLPKVIPECREHSQVCLSLKKKVSLHKKKSHRMGTGTIAQR